MTAAAASTPTMHNTCVGVGGYRLCPQWVRVGRGAPRNPVHSVPRDVTSEISQGSKCQENDGRGCQHPDDAQQLRGCCGGCYVRVAVNLWNIT